MNKFEVYWAVDPESHTARWVVMVRDEGGWRRATQQEHDEAVALAKEERAA